MKTVAELNAMCVNTLVAHLDIEITDVGDDWLCGRMPVTDKVRQPMGLLHGGASVVLAETLASLGAQRCVAAGQYCVGLEINANHIRAVGEGWVYAKAQALHLGGRTQVWSIEIKDEQSRRVCICRMTAAVLDKPV